MLDELIRPTDPNDRRGNPGFREMLHDRAAKAIVQNVVLERADHFNSPGKEFQSADIQRLNPSRVDQGD